MYIVEQIKKETGKALMKYLEERKVEIKMVNRMIINQLERDKNK